jgi:hypothetical protein
VIGHNILAVKIIAFLSNSLCVLIRRYLHKVSDFL